MFFVSILYRFVSVYFFHAFPGRAREICCSTGKNTRGTYARIVYRMRIRLDPFEIVLHNLINKFLHYVYSKTRHLLICDLELACFKIDDEEKREKIFRIGELAYEFFSCEPCSDLELTVGHQRGIDHSGSNQASAGSLFVIGLRASRQLGFGLSDVSTLSRSVNVESSITRARKKTIEYD